jgi:hypothetical protein
VFVDLPLRGAPLERLAPVAAEMNAVKGPRRCAPAR